jgi:hypothetical protein
MKTYRILTVVLVALLLIGCGAAKYQKEKTLLTTMTKAMEALTAAISSADNPAKITSAISAFTGKIETLVPDMKKVSDEHPEWETDPPPELKDTMEKFASASSGLHEVMPKLMQMANQHADNAELQDALKKFQSVVGGL